MHLPFELLLLSLLYYSPSTAAPILAARDADFESVRTTLEKSFVDPDPKHPNKYFHESTFHQHYDGRFADQPLKYDQKQKSLSALIRAYLSTMSDIGLQTWLMHGTLLGWYWNRKNMPWDSDLDVMVSEDSMRFLASYYNMTMHHFRPQSSSSSLRRSKKSKGRIYLLEINPHYREYERDKQNQIDARWIDTDSGLFIDITTLRRERNHTTTSHDSSNNGDAMMSVKDNHHYTFDDIYPLRETEFEGTPVLVPFAYPEILTEEYGDGALSDVFHDGHRFDVQRDVWVPQEGKVVL